MQEKNKKNHLVLRKVADVSATLRSFKKGDMELIPFAVSGTTTETFRSRYHVLKKKNLLEEDLIIRANKEPVGTYIICTR